MDRLQFYPKGEGDATDPSSYYRPTGIPAHPIAEPEPLCTVRHPTPSYLESGTIERHGLASLDGLGTRLAGRLFFFLGGIGPDPGSPERRTGLISHKPACPRGATSDYLKAAPGAAATARSPCTGNEATDHATPSDHAGTGIAVCSPNIKRTHIQHSDSITGHRQSTRRDTSDAAPNGIEDVDRRPPGESFLATIQRDSTRITTESDSRLTGNSRTSAIFPALAGSGRCSSGGTTTWGKTNASDDESDASAQPASRSTRAPSDYARGLGGGAHSGGVVEEAAKDKGGRM